MFVGRETELKELGALHAKPGFQMIVVYGRRRVGKTTLLSQFAADKKHIYFTAQESNDKANLSAFSQALYQYAGLPANTGGFGSWADALAFLAEQAERDRLIVVFDEFPYAAQANDALPSILQSVIDHTLQSGQLFLVLSGSNVGFMESDVLGAKSPLHGRRTAQIHLLPFDYLDAAKMLKGVSPADCLRYYACLGGVPHYLGFVDGQSGFANNIVHLFYGKSSIFADEPLMLLRQELREPALYNAILTALAKGANTPQLIADAIGEERTKVMKYLSTLLNLGLIEKRIPMFANQAKTRKGIYRIADPLFAFWYRCVFPYHAEVELGAGEVIARNKVLPNLSELEGLRFEDVCLQWLRRMNTLGKLPFIATALGYWWGTDSRTRQQTDVDVIAAEKTSGQLLLGECKWQESLQGGAVLKTLVDKDSLFPDFTEFWHYLFCKTDFDAAANRIAKENPSIALIGLSQLFS
ncbi:MAG: ATP-binding protein [Coriobacteriales bacterium]|jgi:AAA+ ATPase superfamily predicted ATPase|nr:ATP-binding protein [Coriobacteriales bacterium]